MLPKPGNDCIVLRELRVLVVIIAYPLDTCLVADKKLGSMGKPHEFIYEKRQIKFCCIGCDDEFNSNTKKYIQKFDQAVEKNKSNTTKSATNNSTK